MNIEDNTGEDSTKQSNEKIPLNDEVKEEIEEELGKPSISLDISTDKKQYKNGDTILYKIKLINDGEVDLEDIKIVEDLNKEEILKLLEVDEEKVFEKEFKISDENTLEEIKNKVEVKVNFNDKDLQYEKEFKVGVIKEEVKVAEPKKEEKVEEVSKEDEPKKEEPKEEDELLENYPPIEGEPKIILPASFYHVTNKMSKLEFTDTIKVFKTAKRSPGCRTFEVILKITGTPQKAPVDVVLVIDRSASMNEAATYNPTLSRLYYAKDAAIKFAGRVLGLNGIPGSRVSIVTFNGPGTRGYTGSTNANTTINIDLTDNLTSVVNTIDNISAAGGTNTEAGFLRGKEVIQNSTSNQRPDSSKVVIMFTDGMPTGSNNAGAGPNAPTSPNAHTVAAYTAGQSIHGIADVITIGLLQGMSTNVKALAVDTLTRAQNKGFYDAPTATDLDAIFTTISQGLGYSAQNAKVVDKLGENFDLVPGSLPAVASYNNTTREITWNPGTIGSLSELKYVVVAKPEFAGGPADTNKYATLTYKDIFGTAGKTKTFPIPEVDVPTLIKVTLTDASIIIGESIQLGIETVAGQPNYMSPVTGGDNNGNFTYEWRVVGDNAVISTDKNPTVSPTVTTEYEVSVTDSNGCVATDTMKVTVTKKFDFGIKKVIKGSEDLLDGAKFELKKDETVIKTEVTLDGYVWMNDLLPGEYTLQETEAPTGYKLNNQVYTITIAMNGDITVDPNLTTEEKDGKKVFVIENEELEFSLGLKKIIKGTQTPLEGAKFELKKDGTVIPTQTTAADGYIWLDNLLAGEYTLQETQAPVGYKPNNQIYTITISNTGVVTVDPELTITTVDDKQVIVIENEELEFSIGLKKIDKKSGDLLDGAKFLLTKDGAATGTELVVTGGYIEIDNLLAGTYTLKEIVAPDGYKLNNKEYTIIIAPDGTVTLNGVTIEEDDEGINVIVIDNQTKAKLPDTGGPGTIIFTLFGLGLMAISYIGYKRRYN